MISDKLRKAMFWKIIERFYKVLSGTIVNNNGDK